MSPDHRGESLRATGRTGNKSRFFRRSPNKWVPAMFPLTGPCRPAFVPRNDLSRPGEEIMPQNRLPRKDPEHREAVRLSWKSRHIPVGSILMGLLVLAGVLSAIFMVLAEGPSNPMP